MADNGLANFIAVIVIGKIVGTVILLGLIGLGIMYLFSGSDVTIETDQPLVPTMIIKVGSEGKPDTTYVYENLQ